MIHKPVVAVISAVLALAACTTTAEVPQESATSAPAVVPSTVSGPAASPSSDANSEQNALREAVLAYSDAFLDAKPTVAYDLFSARCRDRVSLSEFTGILMSAKQAYGKALPLKTFDAQISGDLARVTYTYDVSALDQTKEPWVREEGEWKQDDC